MYTTIRKVNLIYELGATFQSPSTVISVSSLTNDSEYSISSSRRRDRECWAAEEEDDAEERRVHPEQRANVVTEVVEEDAIGTQTICCSVEEEVCGVILLDVGKL